MDVNGCKKCQSCSRKENCTAEYLNLLQLGTAEEIYDKMWQIIELRSDLIPRLVLNLSRRIKHFSGDELSKAQLIIKTWQSYFSQMQKQRLSFEALKPALQERVIGSVKSLIPEQAIRESVERRLRILENTKPVEEVEDDEDKNTQTFLN